MAEKSERSQKEEAVLRFWKENRIFEKSLEKESPKGEFAFYDGPPFATGMPHFGHILPGTIKDVIPRYKTMLGYKVPRKWGWDCHGLPIENLIEKELGLATKKDIEAYGIDKFNQKAKDSVLRYEKEWREIIPRTGRWVDMENAYKTMDSSYTESVWWSFKELHDKGLVYQGFKIMHLCPRCGTTLSNFEVNQGYKDVSDISAYVKFKIKAFPDAYFLAWTTTPWTLPGNVALAVGADIEYVEAKVNGEVLVLAKEKLSMIEGEYEVLATHKGSEMAGMEYEPVFDYYSRDENLKNRENGWKVYAADFVNTEDGTGIVHIAPAFGGDDYELAQKENLPFVQHVDLEGKMKLEAKDFAGIPVKPKSDDDKERLATDIAVIRYLQEHGNFFAKEKIVHSYPHCWRCDTPLINYASSSWFVRVTDIKGKLIKNNSAVKWVPEDIRDGRFGKWLEGARDWAVSRSRFWGAPLPVWQNADSSKTLVVDSIETLKKYAKKSGNKYILMRHGEADHNVKDVLDLEGDPNIHLTEKGREQAKNAKVGEVDLVFSSSFPRAVETAEIIKKDFIVDERLREMRPEETYVETRKRMLDFIFEMEKKHKGKNILIVSHQGPFKALAEKSLDVAEAYEFDFAPFPHNSDFELDLHRPYIDEMVLEKDGEEYKRVPEVFDTWYDSGSVPFASRQAKDFRSADFIAEGLDQTRGWFYTLLILSTALFGKSPYKQVVVNGLVLAEDGRKMSKRLKNYPDITDVLDKFGADALRYFLLSSPAVRAEDIAFSEKGLDEVNKKITNRLYNVVSFYELYSGSKNSELGESKVSNFGGSILDKWLDARLVETTNAVTEALEKYELDRAARPLADFVDDLSTWYLRRSRNRPEALPKLRDSILEFLKLLAPFMPFASEDLYQKLKKEGDPESVHLCEWPLPRQGFTGKALLSKMFGGNKSEGEVIENMAETRRLVSLGLEARQKANIKVRQPLAKLEIKNVTLGGEYLELVRDEVNVKEVSANPDLAEEVRLDTVITPELEEEGKLRDAIRSLQDMRKEKNLRPGDKMAYEVKPEEKALFLKYAEEIKKATNIEF